MSGRVGDFLVSVLGGVTTYVILQAITGTAFTSLPEVSTYRLPFQINKHFLAISSLVFLLMLTISDVDDKKWSVGKRVYTTFFSVFGILLVSIPISYVISIFIDISFTTGIFALVFIGIVFMMYVALTYEEE